MFRLHFVRIAIFALLGALGGFVMYRISPSVYESQSVLVLSNQLREGSSPLSVDVQEILSKGAATDPLSERALLQSRLIFDMALVAYSRMRQENTDALNIRFWDDRYYSKEPNPSEMAEVDVYLSRRQQDQLYQMFNVTSEENSSSVELSAKAYSVEQAFLICAAVANAYRVFRTEQARQRVDDAIGFLRSQMIAAEQGLSESDRKIAEIRTKTGVADIQTALAGATQNETMLGNQQQELQGQIKGLEASIASDRARLAGMPEFIESGELTTTSPLVDQLDIEISQAQGVLDGLLKTYRESAPAVQRQRAIVAALEQQRSTALSQNRDTTQRDRRRDPVREAVRERLLSSESQLRSLREQLAAKNSEVAQNLVLRRSLAEAEKGFRELERTRNVFEQRYQSVRGQYEELLGRREQAGAALAPSVGRAFPTVNPEKVAPDLVKLLFIGLIAGICVGMIYSFSVESLRLRVHTSTQLEALTGLPVVAALPTIKRPVLSRLLKAIGQGTGGPTESFRYMAVSMMAAPSPRTRIVLLTSVAAGPDRASSAIQLAVAAARGGVNTILVDADFKRGLISQAFNLRDQVGLSDILSKALLPTSDDVALGHETKQPNLRVIPTGGQSTVHLADYGIASVGDWIDSLRDYTGLVVIDSASCVDSSDAAVLCSKADEVLLVASAKNAPHKSVPSAYEVLRRAGAKSVNLIMVDASEGDEPFTVRSGQMRSEAT